MAAEREARQRRLELGDLSTQLAPGCGVVASRSATNVPRPCSLRTTPSDSSRAYTARAVLTFTPAASASSRTLGADRSGEGAVAQGGADAGRELGAERNAGPPIDSEVEVGGIAAPG